MIFASDPQLLWLSAGLTDEHLGANPLWCDGDCYDRRAKETNRRQLLGMNTIQFASSFADGTRGFWPKSADAGKSAGRQIKRPQGVVINGDLTAFWQHHTDINTDEVRLFRQHYEPAAHYAVREALQLPLYPGLGNHDYANNVEDCTGTIPHYSHNYGNNACAHEAIDYMKTAVACGHVKNFPTGTVVSFDRDSLVYAFDVGNYRFVQMHNYPTYARSAIGIKDSTTWLKKVLDDANATGKHAVLDYHDPHEHWTPSSDQAIDNKGKIDPDDATGKAFRDALKGQDVVAIFAGHFHETWGRHGSVSVDGSDAFLVIWVEGVDLGERDKVSFNGEDIGYLAQQTFYNEVYEVKAGPGIYGLDRTDLVPSFFTIPSDKLESTNTVSIEMDNSGGGYVAEVETSDLLVQSPALIPEPGTWAQLAAGLGTLTLMLGRPRKQ